jgi:glycine/serine hydroxymethyltransferase
MTRFGMREEDFHELAVMIHDVVRNNNQVIDKVKGLRERFSELQFCFRGHEYDDVMQKLHELL